jgi:RNA polymerase sigma-70 factor (ECF subfamily)
MDDRDLRWQAVERAYRDHADDVYRVALAILRDPDAAVDATHDTFARAFDRWDQYDANRSLRAWLHGIVSHAAIDDLRRRRVRRLAAPTVGHVSRLTEEGADPAEAVTERDLIEEGLAALEPNARAVLILRHYYGYDYAQIGGFLRMSPGTVGSILSRSHASLRRRFETADLAPATDPAGGRRAAR